MIFVCFEVEMVEVVGDGEPSHSGWEFGSECGSVAVSGVLVVTHEGDIVFFCCDSDVCRCAFLL